MSKRAAYNMKTKNRCNLSDSYMRVHDICTYTLHLIHIYRILYPMHREIKTANVTILTSNLNESNAISYGNIVIEAWNMVHFLVQP